MNTVDPGPLTHWKLELKPIEVHYVNKHLSGMLEKYDYEKLLPKGNPLIRNKGESLKTYIRNRLFKIY